MVDKNEVLALVDAFGNLDKARDQAAAELVKAANQAMGANMFHLASFSRHTQGLDIILTARIPIENPSEFWDRG